MATGGCPALAKLRPMARFHLPFATREETLFRSASAYLLGQYFLKERGEPHELGLEGLGALYEEIRQRGFHWSIGEREQGVATISAPVFGKHWRLLGSLCVSGPASRLPQQRLEEMAPTVIAAANASEHPVREQVIRARHQHVYL